VPNRPEIPLAPLADLQHRVSELEETVVPMCEQMRVMIQNLFDMIRNGAEQPENITEGSQTK
jgi:hypothetical protein